MKIRVGALLFFVFLICMVSSAAAIDYSLEYSSISEMNEYTNILGFSFSDLPDKEDYIIHQANLILWYRPTIYQPQQCTNTPKRKELSLYSREESGSWHFLTKSDTSSFIYFNNDISDHIDKNNYTFKIQSSGSNYTDTCIYIENGTLIVNYTEKGEMSLEILSDSIKIPYGNNFDMVVRASCTEGFCGTQKYSIMSEKGRVVAEPFWGKGDLDMGDSETVTIPLKGEHVGSDRITIEVNSYFKNNEIKVPFQSDHIDVNVSDSPGSAHDYGNIVVGDILVKPDQPIYEGNDANISVNVSCTKNYCGNITPHISTRMNVMKNPASCILGNPNVCEFNWVLGYVPDSYHPYGVSLTFDSDISSVGSQSKSTSITYTKYPVNDKEFPGSVNIVINHPKPKSLFVGDNFELEGTVTCTSTNDQYCEGAKIYALYKRPGGDEVKISQNTDIFITNPYQKNPKEYSITPLKRWNIQAKKSGTYYLGLKSVDKYGHENSVWTDLISILPKSEEINKTEYSIEIISPEPGAVFKRGDEITIKAKVLKNESVCTECVVNATSGAFPGGKVLSFKNPYFEGSVHAGDNSYGVNTLVLTANLMKSASVEILIDPSISIDASTGKDSYEVFENISVSGIAPPGSSVSTVLACADKFKKESTEKIADSLGNYEIQIPVTRAFPEGSCSITVSATDPYNNTGTKSVGLWIKHPDINMFNLEIISPERSGRILKGESVDIRVRVTQSNKGTEGMNVTCQDAEKGQIKLQDKGKGIYSASYKIPVHADSDEWIVSCVAEKDGNYGSNSLILLLEDPEIIMKVIEPNPYEQLPPGETLKIKVKATYPDGTPVENARIKMKVNGGKEVILRATGNGTYSDNFETKDKEVVSLDFSASDGLGVTGGLEGMRYSVKSTDIGPFITYMAGIIVLIAIIFSVTIVYVKKGKGKTTIITKTEKLDINEIENKVREKHTMDRHLVLKEKLRDLQIEYENINNDIDLLHKEYYKREIDEETFIKLLQERKEKKVDIMNSMNSIMNEIKQIEEKMNINNKGGNNQYGS